MHSSFVKRLIAVSLAISAMVGLTGCSFLETVGGRDKNKPYGYSSVDDLDTGMAYVWIDEDANDIKDDLERRCDKNVFFRVMNGDYNFKGNEAAEISEYPRSIWVRADVDDQIPTVTSKNKLIYVSETTVPEKIIFERFGDYGYTIGVSNLIPDGGDHYFFCYAENDSDDYKYYVDMNSDAADLIQFETISRLYLDKVDGKRVTKENISKGGTVTGLKKGEKYICEFYTGTYYQDFELTADIHTFGSFERFVSYDFEFLHSNCIAITIPSYFKSGYYYVNGVGIFRYVADEDLGKYNGKSYDENIDWNDPIIIYDENGFVVSDPSDPDWDEEKAIEDASDPGEEDFEPNIDRDKGEEEPK